MRPQHLPRAVGETGPDRRDQCLRVLLERPHVELGRAVPFVQPLGREDRRAAQVRGPCGDGLRAGDHGQGPPQRDRLRRQQELRLQDQFVQQSRCRRVRGRVALQIGVREAPVTHALLHRHQLQQRPRDPLPRPRRRLFPQRVRERLVVQPVHRPPRRIRVLHDQLDPVSYTHL